MECAVPGCPRELRHARVFFCWPASRFSLKFALRRLTHPLAERPVSRRNRYQISDVDTKVLPAQTIRFGAAPRWVDVLFIALVVYVITGTLWMLTGFGGAEVTHYVGLLSDAPAALASAIVAAATTPFSPWCAANGVDLVGGRAGSVFRRRCHRHDFLAARPRSVPGSR